ncbi:hypothetical protein ScalyP_jg12118 [Parmales sp. scaly parma]|nr:hypothetical protein ScalyP_jg12118 [Parmales sp. scaly parma]
MFNPLLLVATILSALLVSILPPLVAPDLYNQCFFHYSSATLKFDNTAWTWATDYGLSVWMGFGIIPLLRNAAAKKGGVISLLSHNSAMLLLCYASSVFFGAICHQNYNSFNSTNPSNLNTLSFRFFWTLCVASVSCAGGYIGSTATILQKQWEQTGETVFFHSMQFPSVSFWRFYSAIAVIVTIFGFFSMCRPACDIFLAGVTHTLPFFVLVYVGIGGLLGRKKKPIWPFAVLFYGCLGNSPLLWLYPFMVHNTSLSLGHINGLLHLSLFTSWGAQMISLMHFSDVSVIKFRNNNSKKI